MDKSIRERKDGTKWSTIAIRKDTMDILNLLCKYERRTSGQMVAILMRDYFERTSQELGITVEEYKLKLENYDKSSWL